MPAFIDLTGRSFGRWTALRRVENNRHNQPQWLCRCECGNEKAVTGGQLTTGTSKSCGCYNRELRRRICLKRNTTHGHAGRANKSTTYLRWCSMRHRCENPNSSAFHKYGAKGIRVCDRWTVYENFLADMGECPSLKHGIDRIDPKGHYEADNCRWATQKEQQNNRSNNRRLTLHSETLTLAQWSDRTGINSKTIGNRLRFGWPVERALTEPPHNRGQR